LYVHNVYEPTTIDEAPKTPEAAEWKLAADEEMQSLEQMNTWELVTLPKAKTLAGCKWVFKVKNKADGTIERFKARLVAKGYLQKPGTDFDDTFAPVVRLDTLRALLTYAVQKKMLIHQMDAITAFLNGHLQEEVYMEQPHGYVRKGQEHLVC
jgi:Reverse transcriptase (RNA-dependent DNA polymerase)